jgi:hypothetical protein
MGGFSFYMRPLSLLAETLSMVYYHRRTRWRTGMA